MRGGIIIGTSYYLYLLRPARPYILSSFFYYSYPIRINVIIEYWPCP